MLEGPVGGGPFDGAYSLDVIEHIPIEDEQAFITNIVDSITEQGVLIIGSPSIQSQAHASPPSKEGHVNCKDGKSMKELLSRFFHNVFIFSMNDEVVHTGFYPMAHYIFALCCSKTNYA
jgi:2-polyprenyl-3-methyl-5-hydroxy-6-metoxy-1,4-benzoquinol methylase